MPTRVKVHPFGSVKRWNPQTTRSCRLLRLTGVLAPQPLYLGNTVPLKTSQ